MTVIGILAAALLLSPAAAAASVAPVATLPVFPSPFANAITAYGIASSLTISVANNGNQNAHQVDFAMPNANYSVTTAGSSGPDATWAVTKGSLKINGVRVPYIRFTAPCSSLGIAPGAAGTFIVRLTPPVGDTPTDIDTSSFTVTVRTTGSTGTCPSPASTGSSTFAARVKVLLVTGGTASPAQLLGPGVAARITWTITNESSATQASVTVSPLVPSPTTAVGNCSMVTNPIAAHASAAVTCDYTFSAANTTYTFAANAKNGASPPTATAVGATATGTIAVGSANVVWSKAVIVNGRPATYSLAFTVNNTSATAVTQVDVLYAAKAGWVVSGATGLTLSASSGDGDLILTGSIAAGATQAVTVNFSAVPSVASTTTYPFTVKLTPTEGAAYALSTSQAVLLYVPAVADVAGLTANATSTGQALAWTNSGPAHDGVVIFRAPSGTVPASPIDFAVYAAGSSGVVYADPAGSTTTSWTDATVGNFNYRVCARDASYVYSSCSTGFFSGNGWVDAEAYPSGGWVHTVGGNALVRGGLVPGSRIAQANNSPSVVILDTATGQRAFPPVAIPALPSMYTPAAPLGTGRTVLFAADQAGNVTAVDTTTGQRLWEVNKPGETFTAGVAGIARAYASAAFQAAYSMDVLVLGSTTGTVYAIDTTSGATLWTLGAGAGVYGLIVYDASTDLLWVPTAGAGVRAFTMAGSSPAVAATPAPGWAFADSSGNYQINCTSQVGGPGLACVNTAGELRIVNQTTGALMAAMFPTGVSAPAALVRVSGSAAPPGLVVASATRTNVLTVTASSTPTIASAAQWVPSGFRTSTPAVYASSGFFVVGGTDGRLHRVSLTTGLEQAQSPRITSQAGTVTLAQPMFDATSNRYLFGTDDGHVWAVPTF
jgi:outer membrane protein assembly factor BamB